MLNNGFKQCDIVKCEQIFIACCVLHNFLLDLMVHNHVRAGRGYPINNDGLQLDGHTVDVDNNGPTLHYVEGPHNVIADTLSRLSHNDIDIDSLALVGKKAASVVRNSESMAGYSSLIDDREILECLLNLPCLH